MIIECQTCHARFRLDESRIKGRGARVKCRKCGNGIVVLKDGGPPPAAPGGDGSFDLGSAVRDSVGDRPSPPSPAGNLIPFPAPSRPEPAAAPESSSSPPEPSGTGKDEVDLAFDRFLAGGKDASIPSIGEAAAGTPAPAESNAGPKEPAERPERPPEPDLGGLSLDLGPEEKLDLPPVSEAPPFDETPAVPPPGEFGGEAGFLISDSDTLDFLQEKEKGRGEAAEAPPQIGDISREISASPIDEPDFFLREPDSSPAAPSKSSFPGLEPISLQGNVAQASTFPVAEVMPSREAEPVPPPSGEPATRRAITEPEPERPRSSTGRVLAVAVAILLAAGGYFGFTPSGRNVLEKTVPGIGALWGGKPAATAAPRYDLRNVIGYYESGNASPRILVIKGQVANLSQVEKNGIRVHATLLDNTDAIIAQQVVYAGNMLSGETIRKGNRDNMSKTLENRFGEGLANMNVAPGKAIPFMVVFFDAPANIDGYKLEAKDVE